MPATSLSKQHARVCFLAGTALFASHVTRAAFCDGASHIGCHHGVDRSGRSPGALYDAAAEGLREARTPAERALARKAMKDAFDPAMSDQRAVACNRSPGQGSFQQCFHGSGPAPGLRMTLPCQQNISDGRILVDRRYLPMASRFRITHYYPDTPNNVGWTHGKCDIIFKKPESGQLGK